MNIVVEKQPKCVAMLSVEIPAALVHDQRNQIIRSYASKALLPGFRPGKAPRAIIEKRFEKEIVEQLHESLFSDAFDAALQQENLKVLNFGNPENISTQADGSISFVSKLTLAPEIQIPPYKGITVTVPPLAVPDDEIQAQLTGLQERFADFKDIDGRPAANDDFAVIDYSSTIDGKPTEEVLGKPAGYLTGRQDFWLRLDDKAFLPGFTAQLVGMSPGESRDITLTLPADFPVADLQNREMVFHTTLKELKESILPELNDELVNRIAPDKSLAEITEIIRQNMQYERQRKINDMKVNQIVLHLNSLVDCELPDDLVTQETQNQADAMVRRGVQSGMREDEIQSQQAEIFANAGQQAVSNLRTNFILQEIVSLENIVVSDAEMVNQLSQIAASKKITPKKLIKEMQRSGRLPSIRNSIATGKAIDFLVEHADVVESSTAILTED